MEYTWVDQPMWQPLEAFRSDFIHLKIIIQNFTDQVSSPEATTATIDIESGWSYKPVFPHGYQVVKEALCQPEGVYFAGFFSKMSSEATEAAVKDQVARTEAELIQELKDHDSILAYAQCTMKIGTTNSGTLILMKDDQAAGKWSQAETCAYAICSDLMPFCFAQTRLHVGIMKITLPTFRFEVARTSFMNLQEPNRKKEVKKWDDDSSVIEQ